VHDFAGDDPKIIDTWVSLFFRGVRNKRSSTNIPATLGSTGLSTGGRPLALSEFGKEVLTATTAQEAAKRFVVGLIKEKNGQAVLDALTALHLRKERVSKVSLKNELTTLGVTNLSRNTTDHSTLKNWMVAAGLISSDGIPIDAAIKSALGISAAERDEFQSLPLVQQIFLRELRLDHESDPGPFLVAPVLRRCIEEHPHLFDESQFARKVRKPLEDAGWIAVTGLATGRQGGRSGYVSGTKKLLDIPIDQLLPDFSQIIPASIRSRINVSLSEIETDLFGADTYKGGLALELLSVRMLIDLGLVPRHFRLRDVTSAHAEVDLIAEGAHLNFSRWTFQCKRYNRSESKVRLGDVAKEVGIAVFSRSHVVVMVTTGGFSRDSKRYADEVAKATPLQFVFVDGNMVKKYLRDGKTALREFFMENAREVMLAKKDQPLPSE